MKAVKKFVILNDSRGYELIDSYPIEMESKKLFYGKTSDGFWVVFEPKTGMKVSQESQSKAKAIENAESRMEQNGSSFDWTIQKVLKSGQKAPSVTPENIRKFELNNYKSKLDNGKELPKEVYEKYPFLLNYKKILESGKIRPKQSRFLLQLQKLENALNKAYDSKHKKKLLHELILNYRKAEKEGYYGNPGSMNSEFKMEIDIEKAKKVAGIDKSLSEKQIRALNKGHQLMKQALKLQKNSGTITKIVYKMPIQKALKIVSKN